MSNTIKIYAENWATGGTVTHTVESIQAVYEILRAYDFGPTEHMELTIEGLTYNEVTQMVKAGDLDAEQGDFIKSFIW